MNRWTTSLILAGLFTFITLLMMLPSYQILVKPRGQAFDFYASWVGGRAVLAGQDPYGPEATRLIQLGIYKKIIPPEEYQHGFALPAHTTFILLPFILLPFSWSILLWLALQIPLLLVTLFLGLEVLNWSMRPVGLFLLAVLATLGFRYPLIAYSVGQMTIFVIFCMVLSVWLYQRGHPRWAALALICATVRPDLTATAILAAFILTRNSPRRREFLIAFLTMGAVLLLLPAIFVGDIWPLTWLNRIRAYGRENPFNIWPPELLSAPWLSALLVVGLLAWLGRYALAAWRQPTPFNQALLGSAMILVGLLVLPQTGTYALTLALIPAVILMRYAETRWLRLFIAGSLLAPWLYFALDLGRVIFLLIPLQFILLQEIVNFTRQRRAYS